MMESRTEFLLSHIVARVSRVMKPLPSGSQRENTWHMMGGDGGGERGGGGAGEMMVV